MMLVELFYATLFLQDEREFSVDQSSNDSDDGSDGNEEDELPLSFPVGIMILFSQLVCEYYFIQGDTI